MRRKRRDDPANLSTPDVQEALEEIADKLCLAGVTMADVQIALHHVARLEDEFIDDAVRQGKAGLKELRGLAEQACAGHQKLHELEGEGGQCNCHPCRSTTPAVRAHARGVRRLEAWEFRLFLNVRSAPLVREWTSAARTNKLQPWQHKLGSVCHFLNHKVDLTFTEIGLLRLLAEGQPTPSWDGLYLKRDSSKTASSAFAKSIAAGPK